MSELAERLVRLRLDINRIADRCGRDPSDVELVVASKRRSDAEIAQLAAAGQRLFGESRVQEFSQRKIEGPKWHFIGTLQRNKVRQVVGRAALIHSVDTPQLAGKIADVAEEFGIVQPILLQVNVSGEESKHGLSPEQWENHLPSSPSLEVRGLMTMAPKSEDQQVVRSCFATLRRLCDRWGLKELSMGMSSDYPIAIEEGATLIRIGHLLFEST